MATMDLGSKHMLAAACFGATIALTSPVGAAPSGLAQYKPTTAEATARFTAGNRLYKSGADGRRPFADRVRDLKRAIDEYRAGRQLEPAAAFDYNIARAAMSLGETKLAVEHWVRCLGALAEDDAAVRDAVNAEISKLDPDGSIRAELERRRGVENRPTVPTAPPVVQPPHQVALPASPMTTTPNATAAPTERETWSGWRPMGWGLTLAGVVGGGVTTWLAVSASSINQDAKQSTRTISERLELQDRADSRRSAALIVGVGSGVAVAAGILMLIVPNDRDHSTARSVGLSVGFTGDAVVLGGAF